MADRWVWLVQALHLLHNCSFSFADGFDGIGAPRSLRIDVKALQLGAGGGNYARDLLENTEASLPSRPSVAPPTIASVGITLPDAC